MTDPRLIAMTNKITEKMPDWDTEFYMFKGKDFKYDEVLLFISFPSDRTRNEFVTASYENKDKVVRFRCNKDVKPKTMKRFTKLARRCIEFLEITEKEEKRKNKGA